MIEIVLGITLCVFIGFIALGAIVINYEEHEERRRRREKKKND